MEHLVADCPKHEVLKKKKKGKVLIGAWDQDISKSEGDEKANICFMAMENEVQSSPSNSSSLIDDICDDDPCTMLIEMYGECKKFSKRNKELKNKINFCLMKTQNLFCSNNDFQKLILENKKLCEKVHSLEKFMVDYDVLKKKVSDLTICVEKFTKRKENFENFLALKDHLLIKMVLDIIIPIFFLNKHGL
ncbi:hypothetical protein M9H77_13781 [Catharanthus roseus]|uniref:Uncharacterized protein n=1 Tax=Catharanthus roseus TaxID=4058 RepID=A0ACC0BL49_CATRO|nr:hypothetical protein M9H77_13781 [Catharanthus roseus]